MLFDRFVWFCVDNDGGDDDADVDVMTGYCLEMSILVLSQADGERDWSVDFFSLERDRYQMELKGSDVCIDRYTLW